MGNEMSASTWCGSGAPYRMIRWLATVACLIQIGCTSGSKNVLESSTTNGATVRQLLVEDRPNVVLYYPASFCFTCAQEVSEWQRLARGGRVHLVILLAGEPSDAERRSLAVRRIPVSGVVTAAPDQPLPQEYLVEEGKVRVATRGAAKTGQNSPVLAAIRKRVAATPSNR